jgi:FkbM family methyltransferase
MNIIDILKQDDLVFDIGAHTGNNSAEYLKKGTKIICFEPQPNCVKILNDRFEQDIINGNIIIEQIGIGNKIEQLPLFICNKHTVLSTFSELWKQGRFKDQIWDDEIIIQIDTLDNMINKYSIPVFCKIDVEGFEPQVLDCLSKKIPYLSFEFVYEMKNNILACLNKLEILGYKNYNITIFGEEEFIFHSWTDRNMIMSYLDKITDTALWGDIYAQG